MADSFIKCLDFTLLEEGGWSDNPADPGGCTQCGITLGTYREWKNDPKISCHDLMYLTAGDIQIFYRDVFWLPLQAERLPLGIDLMVFDAGVNMGASQSVRLLQASLDGTKVDGIIGPDTIAAAIKTDANHLIKALTMKQMGFYKKLSNFPTFGKGWINRVVARQAAALRLLSIRPVVV